MEKRQRSRWIFAALGLVAIVLLAWVIFHKPKAKPGPPHAVPVTVARATVQDVDVTLTNLGAAQAWQASDHRGVARHPRYPREGRLFV